MNCRQVHEHIERYYEGVLPVADELGIDIHLVQCAACAEALGGVNSLVEDCGCAFDVVPSSSDLKGLHEQMDTMVQQVAQQDSRRAGFRKKDVVMHLVLAIVAVPVFWMLSTKAIETYSAYSDILPEAAVETGALSVDTVPPYISRNVSSVDW